MSIQRRHGKRGIAAGLDLTALVDVALLLVVFMLFTARKADAGSAEQELPVQLPTASTGEAPGNTQELVLVVLEDGAVLHEGRQIRREEVSSIAGGVKRAVLRIDKRCRHGDVVAVVDALRAAGVAEVAEMTEQAAGEETW